MNPMEVKCILLSNFTIDPLSVYLKSSTDELEVKCSIAPIDQIRQVICSPNNECWKAEPRAAIIWTMPFKAVPSFEKHYYENKDYSKHIKEEVSEFANYIKILASRVSTVIVPSWTLPSYFRGSGVMDYRNSNGIYNTLSRMNLQLADELESMSNVYILAAEKWIMSAQKAEDDRMWYLGKVPFTREVFISAAADIKALFKASSGKGRKLIVLDLDNTLWGGVLGDVGMDGLILGGIDPAGEAYIDFQKCLLALKKRGIMLAIASKNTEENALLAIDKHPEMILRSDDFVSWRINWKDKASNIIDIVNHLNIGLNSVVFIDDSPYERARVSETLKDVLVPQWPEDPVHYKSALLSLECFDAITSSHEDNERVKYYHTENRRRKYMKEYISIDKWLHSLDIRISYEWVSSHNISRAVQLLNKTNQFNLITRRMEKKEFTDYIQEKNIETIIFRVKDKFGDYGQVGLVSFELDSQSIEIKDFVLSCRAMGRGIEKAMLYIVSQYALSLGKKSIFASYFPTERNKPCEDFLTENGFIKEGRNFFKSELIEKIILPSFIYMEEYIETVKAN